MEDEAYWVGLDMGLEQTNVCVVNRDGEAIVETSCQTEADDIEQALGGLPMADIRRVGLEAGVGIHVVRELRRRGFPVLVLEVRKASRFLAVRRNKTDVNDARGLAELARIGRTIGSEVFVKSLECQNIRTLLVTRHKLIQQRMSIEGLIQTMVRLHGGKLKLRGADGALQIDVESQLSRLADDGLDVDDDVRPLVEIARAIRAHITRLDRKLAGIAKAHAVCRRFMEIPGVGPISALSFYTAVSDPSRFRKLEDIGAYLGLTPLVRQSGRYARQGSISKMGNKLTRTHLVSAATVLITRVSRESALREWATNLVKRVGRAKARVAVARKLAVLMMRLWKSGEAFNPFPAKPFSA